MFRIFYSFFSIVMIVSCCLAAFTQQPEQMDIRSLSITYQGVEPFFAMTVSNSAGQSVTYTGYGTFNLPNLFTCKPCAIPHTFGSNGYQVFGIPGAQFTTFQWSSDAYVYIWVTDIDAKPIVVTPRYPWKSRKILVSAQNTISGRVEIRNQADIVLAYANDLNLQGRSISDFSLNNNYPQGRKIWFNRIDVRLEKPLNLSRKVSVAIPTQ